MHNEYNIWLCVSKFTFIKVSRQQYAKLYHNGRSHLFKCRQSIYTTTYHKRLFWQSLQYFIYLLTYEWFFWARVSHYTWLERLARDKPSCLMKLKCCECNSWGRCYKTIPQQIILFIVTLLFLGLKYVSKLLQ